MSRIARLLGRSVAALSVVVALAAPSIAEDEIEPGRLETSFDVAQQLPTTVEPGRLEDSFDEPLEPKSTFEPMIEKGEEVALPAGAQSVTFTLAGIVVEGSTVYEAADFTPLYEVLVGGECA